MKPLVTFCSLLLIPAVIGGHDLQETYHFSAPLDGSNYVLHWNVDLQNEVIHFAVNVTTTGWIGFGLSPNGQMPDSDVVIAWVDSTGQVFFNDRHAVGRYLPLVDDSQDWTLVNGTEENGRTIVEFNRPLLSCDTDGDIDITIDTSRVVWSYHSQDPADEEELAVLQHDRKGSASINFLGGLNEERVVEDSAGSFTILNDNVLIPPNDTTYWCTVHSLANEASNQEKYIYKFSPVISSAPFVHHLVAYLCNDLNDSHVGISTRCTGSNDVISHCRLGGILFAAWAVGGSDFVFPNDVAYPIGGKGREYIMLEVHYDNPQMVEGVINNSGLCFFYSEEEPPKRAGLLTLGHRAKSSMIIPPHAERFTVNGLCSSSCTEKFLPDDGINSFGNLLHTHLAGRGLVLRQFRETEECGGLQELQPIDKNLNYDFNYQQVNVFPKNVQILPGDQLQLQCFYDTSDPSYNEVTLGGESTRQEMCLAFLYYYPEVNLTYCLGSQTAGDEFTTEYLSPDDEATLSSSLADNDYQSVSHILNQVEWNQQSIDAFQTAVQSNPTTTFCISGMNSEESFVSPGDVIPEADCPYQPPVKDCPVSGANTVYCLSCYYAYLTVFLLYMFW